MSNELAIGDRVKHPTKADWGTGQITAVDYDSVTVYFETGGEKKLKTNYVTLEKLDGDEAESSVLDSKFKAKKARQKRAYDPNLYNGGKKASRKEFIESLGATCSNWNWSWSFVNETEKKVIFGVWQDFKEANRGLIFSYEWRTRDGKRRPSWPESRENIRLVEEAGYSLHVFTMFNDPDAESEYENGARKIAAFHKDLTRADLLRDGHDWYAVFAEDSPAT